MKCSSLGFARGHHTGYGVLWGCLVIAMFLAAGCSRSNAMPVSGSKVDATDTAVSIAVTMLSPLSVTLTVTPLATNRAEPAMKTPPAATTARATPSPTATSVDVSLAALLPTPTPTATPQPTPAYVPTPDGEPRTLRIPVLMYHYLSVPPADADIYRLDLSVPPDLFAEQLDRLLAEGYTTISPYDLVDALQRGVELPENPILITFDDGYRDNYENAFPLLRERRMQATIFVVTDFIDEERPAYLSWEMAREMIDNQIAIESHGRNHAGLAEKDDDYLVWQALGSLETIEYELGVRPRFVSYPAGEYDQRTIDVFRSAGYWGGFTTEQGTEQSNASPFELERIRVRNTTTADELIRLLSLDW